MSDDTMGEVSLERLQQFAADPMEFILSLQIPTPGRVQPLRNCIADFQRRDFEALVPSMLAMARCQPVPRSRFFIERTKGASKDGDAAAEIIWLSAFSPRKLSMQICAVDADQARLIKDAVDDRLRLNHFLNDFLESQSNKIINRTTGSVCEILTSDSESAHGARPDVVWVNEAGHFRKRDFFDAVLTNCAKNPNTMLVILTNAGFIESFAYKLRKEAKENDRWYFSVLDEPAPWISAEDVAEQERILPASLFARYWRGVWSSGAGDALNPDDIDAAFDPDHGPMLGYEKDVGYVAGLDLATKRDHAAFCVLGWDWVAQRVYLAHLESWAPGPNGVDLSDVREHVRRMNDQFGFGVNACYYDPYQCELLARDLRDCGIQMTEVPFVGKNLDLMASTLLQAFRDRTITLYEDAGLRRDLSKLCIVEKSFGFKLEAPRDEHGHCDRAMSMAICLPFACEAAATYHRFANAETMPESLFELTGTLNDYAPMRIAGRLWDG